MTLDDPRIHDDTDRELRTISVVETGFPRELHPRWRELRDSTRQWLVDQQMLPATDARVHVATLRYTDLAASCYIGAPMTTLTAIGDFFAWFFIMDDQHHLALTQRHDDRWRHLHAAMRSATQTPQCHRYHDDPLVASLTDCLARLYACLSPRWAHRFIDHFLPVLDSYNDEYRNRTQGKTLSVFQYEQQRQLTFGHQIWIDLLELAADHELPATVRDSNSYRRAAMACQDFSAWYNDLYSLPKEAAAGDTNNYVTILGNQEHISLWQAQVEVHRRTTTRVYDFLDAEKDLNAIRHHTDPVTRTALSSCIHNMRNWISAVYHFHHVSGRYAMDRWPDPANPPYVYTSPNTPQTDQTPPRPN